MCCATRSANSFACSGVINFGMALSSSAPGGAGAAAGGGLGSRASFAPWGDAPPGGRRGEASASQSRSLSSAGEGGSALVAPVHPACAPVPALTPGGACGCAVGWPGTLARPLSCLPRCPACILAASLASRLALVSRGASPPPGPGAQGVSGDASSIPPRYSDAIGGSARRFSAGGRRFARREAPVVAACSARLLPDVGCRGCAPASRSRGRGGPSALRSASLPAPSAALCSARAVGGRQLLCSSLLLASLSKSPGEQPPCEL